MSASSRLRVPVALLGVILALSGCASSTGVTPTQPPGATVQPTQAAQAAPSQQGTPPSASPAGSSQPQEATIYFGTGAVTAETYLVPVLTIGRRILKDQGIDLEYAALSTDEVVEAAIDRNRIDVGLLAMVGVQRAVKAGLHMKWTLTNEVQNTFQLVVHSDVTDLAQLKGKNIGIQDPTSLNAIQLPMMMQGAGLTKNDYKTTYLAGSVNRAAALSAGTMDATILYPNVARGLVAKSGGKFKIWGEGQAPTDPPMMWDGFVMSDAFRANTKLSTAFIKACIEAYKEFYAGDPATMAKDALATGYLELNGLDAPNMTQDYKSYQTMKLYPLDGGLQESYYTPMLKLLVDNGLLKQEDTVPYADAVDPSIVAAATK